MSYSENPFLPQMLSPAAYEMGRYGRTPASHFYGLPNISVPLAEVRAKGYNLPIFLSYNAGGNRPEQHPGWAGLGWSLHAGGSIVRVINGMKDEMSRLEYDSLLVTGDISPSSDPGYLYHIGEVQSETDWDNGATLAQKSIPWREYEPDEYIINVDGIHASFFITGDNEISIVSKDESSFELESYDIGSDDYYTALDMYSGRTSRAVKARRYKYLKRFVIRDKNGNRYTFGGDDSSIEYSVVQHAVWNPTGNSATWKAIATANAWMLTKIERADGEVITFEYEKNGVPIILRDIHHGELFVEDGTNPYTYDTDTYRDSINGRKSNLNFHFLLPSYLKSISCLLSGDELTFTSSDSVELPCSFTEADFKKYVIDPSGNYDVIPYSEFLSENRYRKLTRISGVSRDIRLVYAENTSSRLKLSSVVFYDSGQEDRRYTFSYNGTSLPPYNSRKTDIWGYYNGIDYSDLLGGFGQGLTERRTASENMMKAEILTAVTYPTGGRTEYEYEAHRYSKKAFPFTFTPVSCSSDGIAGGLRIKSITDYAADGVPQRRTFEYSENGVSSGILCAEGACRSSGRHGGVNYVGSYVGAFVLYSELPILPLSETDGRHVTYSFVRERFPDGSHVDYRFSNFDTSGCQDAAPAKEVGRSEGCPLYPKFTSNALARGLLQNRKTYKSDGSPVLEESFTYASSDSSSRFKSVSQHRFCNGVICFSAYVSESCIYPSLVTRTEKRHLDDGTQVTDLHSYSHTSSRLPQSHSVSRNGYSSGEYISYPSDRSGSSYDQMNSAGMYGVPVGKAVLRDGNIVRAIETSYMSVPLESSDAPGRSIMVPFRTFSSKMSTPPSLSSYLNTPSSYQNPSPDIDVKVFDGKGNIRFAGLRDGSAMEYHWSERTGSPSMSVRTADVSLADERVTEIYLMPLVSVQPYTKSFVTTRSGTQLTLSLYSNYNYAWYVYVSVDGNTYYMAQWNIDANPDSHWMEILAENPSYLSLTLPAGEHTIRINHVEWKGPSGGAGATGASMQISHYQEKVFHDTATFVDLDKDTETGEGFHCDKGHSGSLTVSHPVVSGKTYILDYMLKSGGVWQYRKSSYSGGSVTIGGSGQSVSNVRIYPSDSIPESFMWRRFTGMSARMSSHGVTESYSYDGAGRLSGVRDNGGRLVRAHSYAFGDDSTIRTDEFTSSGGTSMRSVVDHYDGLGRLSRNVLVGGSPSGSDLVTRHDYDVMDREVRVWLPDVTTGSQYSDPAPYSESVYEPSPQGRLLRNYGPGSSWRDADKAVRTSLLSNVTSASQPSYHRGFDLLWSGHTLTLTRKSSATAAASYLIEKTEDEDGRVRLDFKSIHGDTVLSRMIGPDGLWHDTHFLYDSFGRLAAVLPPKLTAELESASKTSWSENEISALAYLYRYDSRGNCIAKLLPGGGWTYYIYDKGDRLILSQDVIQRSRNEWTFRLSDLFGRECVSGTAVLTKDVFSDPLGSSNVYVTMPASPSYTGTLKGYTASGLSLGNEVTVLKVIYYDGYGFLGSGPFPASTDSRVAYDSSAETEYGARYALSDRGLATGSLVRILDSSSAENFLWSVTYYDDRGRPVQIRESVHIGGVRKEYLAYDFTGSVIKRKTALAPSSGSSVTVVQSFSYDSMGRPLTSTHKVGSGSQRIVSSKVYDALGRLVLENRTGLASLKETLSYNVRSWLTGISGTNFSESLKYENSSSPQWGGNISVMEWGTSSLQKCYRFGYDALSRLVSAVYSEGLSAGSCSETYSYDRNGNMMSSVRNGETVALTMSGNRITSAGGTSFVYDSKGRETSGGYGTVRSTQYNLLDLPQRHTIGGGITTVDYSYGADGRKLQEKVTNGTSVTTRDYVGEFLYEGGILKRILFDGGYVDMTSLNPVYVFFLRDHLGSVRSVVTENGSVYQTNDYYPFGDLFSISGGGAVLDRSGSRFRFSGKELSAETGLYDFSARFLHTRFGRFTTMDPLAEKYPGISPYSYCKGNPVNFVDPDGRDWYEDELGNAKWMDKDDSIYVDEGGVEWKNIGPEYIFFSGENLYYYNQSYGQSFNAVSGRSDDNGAFIYTKERQTQIGEGPIPEGLYYINPQEIQSYLQTTVIQKFLGLIGKGTFPKGPVAWGFKRVWIYPNEVHVYDNVTGKYITRGNFSIHGGLTPGSAGCIDLSGNAYKFFKSLGQSSSSYIRLNVNYGYKK